MPTWILAVAALSIAVTAALTWILMRINAGHADAAGSNREPDPDR